MSGLFDESFRSLEEPEIPGYEILEELGRGGHSAVYRARDIAGKERAIKRWLSPELGEHARQRIERESQALASLDHPQIARAITRVHDKQGRPCLVMELIDGPSLAEQLRDQGPLAPTDAAKLGASLAGLLVYLGQVGLVHRDIKPSNILMRNHEPVLIDFSIVKPERPSSPTETLTGPAAALGTSAYMAPEQCEGELGGPIDSRTDIYGLGATLFHALTGHPPWQQESAWERMQRNPWRQPYPSNPDLRDAVLKARKAVPTDLSELIARCLEGRPELRPDKPQQLLIALQKIATPARPMASMRPLALAMVASLSLIPVFYFFPGQSPKAIPKPSQRPTPKERDRPMPKTLPAPKPKEVEVAGAVELRVTLEAPGESTERVLQLDQRRLLPASEAQRGDFKLVVKDQRWTLTACQRPDQRCMALLTDDPKNAFALWRPRLESKSRKPERSLLTLSNEGRFYRLALRPANDSDKHLILSLQPIPPTKATTITLQASERFARLLRAARAWKLESAGRLFGESLFRCHWNDRPGYQQISLEQADKGKLVSQIADALSSPGIPLESLKCLDTSQLGGIPGSAELQSALAGNAVRIRLAARQEACMDLYLVDQRFAGVASVLR